MTGLFLPDEGYEALCRHCVLHGELGVGKDDCLILIGVVADQGSYCVVRIEEHHALETCRKFHSADRDSLGTRLYNCRCMGHMVPVGILSNALVIERTDGHTAVACLA